MKKTTEMTTDEYREMVNARLAKKHAQSDENMRQAGEQDRPVAVGTRISDQVGTVYVVEKVETPEDHEREGRPNVARMMRQHGQTASMVCRRPKGKKCYMGWQYNRNGRCFCYVMQQGW